MFHRTLFTCVHFRYFKSGLHPKHKFLIVIVIWDTFSTMCRECVPFTPCCLKRLKVASFILNDKIKRGYFLVFSSIIASFFISVLHHASVFFGLTDFFFITTHTFYCIAGCFSILWYTLLICRLYNNCPLSLFKSGFITLITLFRICGTILYHKNFVLFA